MWRKRKPVNFGVCLLTLLAVKLWLAGCTLIGYMAWVLATSVTIKQFLSGNLIFTYIVISVGFLLFITGLLGWVGATSGSSCIIRMYIMAGVLSIALEVGGILTLNILRMDMSDVVEHGWTQVNQITRNAVQHNLNCCGYSGPKEFAYRNDPIDDSCYENMTISEEMTSRIEGATTSEIHMDNGRLLKQQGCGRKLKDWFDNNGAIWISILAAIGLLEIIGVAAAIHVLNRKQRRKREENEFELEQNHYEQTKQHRTYVKPRNGVH